VSAQLQSKLEAALAELLAAGAPGALALGVGPWGRLRMAAGLDSGGRALQADAPFEVASVTKTFLAALVLALVEDGALGLDDDVAAHLPSRALSLDSVSVRSLLNHTSGLPDFFEDAAIADAWRSDAGFDWRLDELIEICMALPPHEPGRFHYANSNYLLLGLVIESLMSSPLDEGLRRRIFDPLDLAATRLPRTATAAAGGVVSTADDLARFLSALLAGQVVNERSLREMLTTVPSEWVESKGYGLGIEEVDSLMGFDVSCCGTAWGHVGLGKATTVAFTTGDAKRQVILMANARLTNDAAWSTLNRATWSVLCP
jgi:D-alanyl-D-alanine carboxypeptidase